MVVIEAVKRPWQFNRGHDLPSAAPKRCICSRRLADCLHRQNSMAVSQKFGRGTGVFKGGVGGASWAPPWQMAIERQLSIHMEPLLSWRCNTWMGTWNGG